MKTTPDEQVANALYVKDRVVKWLKMRHDAEIDRARSGIRLEVGKVVVVVQTSINKVPVHIEASVNGQDPQKIIQEIMRKVNETLETYSQKQ